MNFSYDPHQPETCALLTEFLRQFMAGRLIPGDLVLSWRFFERRFLQEIPQPLAVSEFDELQAARSNGESPNACDARI